MNNYEIIKQMGIDEIEEIIKSNFCYGCFFNDINKKCDTNRAYNKLIQWLQAESEE